MKAINNPTDKKMLELIEKKPGKKGILSADSLEKALERQRLFGGRIGPTWWHWGY